MVATVSNSYPMSRTRDRMYAPPPHLTETPNRGSSRLALSACIDGTSISVKGLFLKLPFFLLVFLLRRFLFFWLLLRPSSSLLSPSFFAMSSSAPSCLAASAAAAAAAAAAATLAASAAAASIVSTASRYLAPSTTPERTTLSSTSVPISISYISTSLFGISIFAAASPESSFRAISYSLFPSMRMALYNGGTCSILPVNLGRIFVFTVSMSVT
mmetsp:Transcript_5598/g.10853  ORF Transcript_5598/g.10853 Transcript_5598/m.10853 type:complete len:214 (-) Transcript_5598:651-1292(-)